MSIEALIFDVDGTLADTEEVHRQAFNAAFERLRIGWHWKADIYRELLGVTGGKERLSAYIDRLSVPAAEKSRLREHVAELHAVKTSVYTAQVREGRVPLRPGVERLLGEAREAGLRLAIASTTTAANIDALLQSTLGSDAAAMFDVIACGDQVRQKKPAPDVYRLALETLGVPPERAVALEDSRNGLRSATGAGLWTLITPTFWTDGEDFREAGLVLPHLGDPARPIEGEPGGKLRQAAWLGVDELVALATPPRKPASLPADEDNSARTTGATP